MGYNINSKDFVIGTLVGSMVGASIALMFAPKSGKELRGDINQGATQVKDKASDFKDTAYEKGTELKDRAYEKGSDLKDKAVEKGTVFKEKATDSSQDLTKKVTTATKKATGNIQDRLKDTRKKEDEALEKANDVADSIEKAAADKLNEK